MKRALVLSLILAIGLGVAAFGQTLSGSWETTIVLDLTPGVVWPTTGVLITSEILVDYTVGDWTFSSETDVENGVWVTQDFDFAGVLGAFTISGTIEFDPTGPEFSYMDVEAEVSIAGVTFGAEFELWIGDADLTLTGSGVAGDISIDVLIGLGWDIGCNFGFSYLEIDVGFPFCCADISAEIVFGCDGFWWAEFCFDGLTIENLPWLTLGACVTFYEDEKYFEFTPEIDLGVIGCDFDLFYRLITDGGSNYDPLLIEGFQFDGIQIACEIGGVAFTGITYWGPLDHGPWWAPGPPGILYDLYRYFLSEGWDWTVWEAYQIATTDDGCCGPFSFDVTVYFETIGTLFDVGWVEANLELQVATQFTFSMGINTDISLGTVNDLIFGFLVEW
jgi:hypothetical protein